MADDPNSDRDKTVTLKVGKAKVEPKLAVVKPAPKALRVNVPKAKSVTTALNTTTIKTPEKAVVSPLKKGDLLDEIVTTTSVKRADAKQVIEAFLASTATHLKAGKDLQLPPLGKIKVLKSKDVGQGATALTLRIRTPNQG